MKNTLGLSVLKVEGISEQSGCYIVVDEKLIDVVSILETEICENCVEIPVKGVLKLVVKPIGNNSKFKCSVSLSLEALPAEGAVWLPLYTSDEVETLPRIPSMLPSTRILVSVNQLFLLTPVAEITEYDSSMFEIENSLQRELKNVNDGHEKCKNAICVVNERNKELRNRVVELENRLQDIEREHYREKNSIMQGNHECFSKLAIQLEKYKLHCGSLQVVHEDHVKQVAGIQMMFKQENLQREHIEKQLIRITKEFQDYAKVAEERQISYEAELQCKNKEIENYKTLVKISEVLSAGDHEKDQQLFYLQNQLHNAIEQLQESEFNRKALQQKLEKVAEYHSKELEELLRSPIPQNDQQVNDLTQELKKYRVKCSELESLLDEKFLDIKNKDSEDFSKAFEELQKYNNDLFNELSLTKELLEQEKRNNEVLISQVRDKISREIDLRVKGADEKFVDYLKNYSVEDKFERISEGVFQYDGKKILVAIKNGCLICKVGTGYVGVEKFLKSIEGDMQGIHKRSQTQAVLKEKLAKDEITRSCERKISLIKIPCLKENTEDASKGFKTTRNSHSHLKEKSFTPIKSNQSQKKL